MKSIINSKLSPTGVFHIIGDVTSTPPDPDPSLSTLPIAVRSGRVLNPPETEDYWDSRPKRENVHPALAWSKGVPLEVLDEMVVKVAEEVADEMGDVRRVNNALGKRIKGLGWKSGLELLLRLGILLNWIEENR